MGKQDGQDLTEKAKWFAVGRQWGIQSGEEAIRTAVFYNKLVEMKVPPEQAAVISGHYAAGLVANRK